MSEPRTIELLKALSARHDKLKPGSGETAAECVMALLSIRSIIVNRERIPPELDCVIAESAFNAFQILVKALGIDPEELMSVQNAADEDASDFVNRKGVNP